MLYCNTIKCVQACVQTICRKTETKHFYVSDSRKVIPAMCVSPTAALITWRDRIACMLRHTGSYCILLKNPPEAIKEYEPHSSILIQVFQLYENSDLDYRKVKIAQVCCYETVFCYSLGHKYQQDIAFSVITGAWHCACQGCGRSRRPRVAVICQCVG